MDWWLQNFCSESDFYTKLKKLDTQEGKKDKLFADHVTQVCEARNWVHACKASKLGPVERLWTQDGKLGITIQDPPSGPESGRRTHLL